MIIDVALQSLSDIRAGIKRNTFPVLHAAAWLNTQSVDFHYDKLEVESKVATAFGIEAMGSPAYEAAKNALADANELGCPLS